MTKKNKPLFWIYGNRRDCLRTWNQIVSHLKSFQQDPNVQTMFCGINSTGSSWIQKWATVSDVINTLRSQDLFDTRPRILKIIGLPENYSDIANWFHLVNGRNILVFWGPFGYTKPNSKRWISAKTSKLYRKIKTEGNVIEHPLEAKTDRSAITFVCQIVTEFNKKIDVKIAHKIVQLCGRNLDILYNTIEKLTLYQTGKQIKEEDVLSCCLSDYDDKVWEFLDNLDYGKTEKVLNYLHDFYIEGKGSIGESFYGRINRLFGALLQHYQLLIMLRDTCGNFLHAQRAHKALSTFRKLTPTKLRDIREGKITINELDYRFSSAYLNRQIKNDAIQNMFRKRKSHIYYILSDLYDCIYWCRKHSNEPHVLKLCLDTFVLIVCGKLTLKQANAIRGYNSHRRLR